MDSNLSQHIFDLRNKQERHSIIRILIAAGADSNTKNEIGNQALTEAVICNEYELVKLLIEQRADVNEKHWDGSTPIFKAASRQSKILEILIKNGADVNARDSNLMTPLMYTKSIENFNLLVAAGADINAVNIVQQSCLYMAVCYNQIEIVKALVALGADIENKDVFGKTYLFVAVSKEYIELVEYLLSVGAKINEDILKEATTTKYRYHDIKRLLSRQ